MAEQKVKKAAHTVVIEGMKFKPESLVVRVGDTVTWVNKDIVPHTATAAQKTFDSGEILSSKSWKYVARQKGDFSYICTFHPLMKAVLTVE